MEKLRRQIPRINNSRTLRDPECARPAGRAVRRRGEGPGTDGRRQARAPRSAPSRPPHHGGGPAPAGVARSLVFREARGEFYCKGGAGRGETRKGTVRKGKKKAKGEIRTHDLRFTSPN